MAFARTAYGKVQDMRVWMHATRMKRVGCAVEDRTTSVDVFALSLPLFVELLMQIMLGNASQMILSPLGMQPAAAVGNALQILDIVTIALSAMDAASTVLATRMIGRKEGRRAVTEIAAVALMVNILFSWAFAVGGGYVLGMSLGWGLVGLWVAMCVDEWLRAGFLIVAFARGGWRRGVRETASVRKCSQASKSSGAISSRNVRNSESS